MVNDIKNTIIDGRYKILAPLGKGGMAEVHKAYDQRLEREVALKLISTDNFPPSILEAMLKRFRREATALAQGNFQFSSKGL